MSRRVLRRLIVPALLAVATLVGLALLLIVQPHWLIAALSRWAPDVVWFVDTEQRMVGLTIDDGPDPKTTPAILQLLDAYDARATFFLLSERIPGNDVKGYREKTGLDRHSFFGDPKLVDPAGGDYRLAPDSPVRNLRPDGGPMGAALAPD